MAEQVSHLELTITNPDGLHTTARILIVPGTKVTFELVSLPPLTLDEILGPLAGLYHSEPQHQTLNPSSNPPNQSSS